jgi:microcystin-dependent protein
MSCPTITTIDPTWCIGNSLQYINTNFTNLSGGICDNNSLITGLAAQIASLTSQVQGLASSASSIPAGMIAYYINNTPPTGWLIADGTVVPNGAGTVQGIAANFAALYAAIGTTYGAAGKLPDLRGYFIRSYGTNADGTASGAFGTTEADALQGHSHNATSSDSGHNHTGGANPGQTNAGGSYGQGGGAQLWSGGGVGTTGVSNAQITTTITTIKTDGTNGTPRTSAETRPKNIALLACIKY